VLLELLDVLLLLFEPLLDLQKSVSLLFTDVLFLGG
jgi:hypothetical protein